MWNIYIHVQEVIVDVYHITLCPCLQLVSTQHWSSRYKTTCRLSDVIGVQVESVHCMELEGREGGREGRKERFETRWIEKELA